jgi:dTDP-4-dehydrorhamnose 3,5-epimerase
VIFTPVGLDGAYLIDLERFEDERGFFARTYCESDFRQHGLDVHLVQWSISYSRTRGTIRGLHWQTEPHTETKLVRCIRGAIFDVLVDIRRQSPSRDEWVGIELDDRTRRSLLIPPGFAHGFQTLTDDAEVLYGITPKHVPEAGRGIRWDDPAIAIEWPEVAARVVSEKDRSWPDWSTTSSEKRASPGSRGLNQVYACAR